MPRLSIVSVTDQYASDTDDGESSLDEGLPAGYKMNKNNVLVAAGATTPKRKSSSGASTRSRETQPTASPNSSNSHDDSDDDSSSSEESDGGFEDGDGASTADEGSSVGVRNSFNSKASQGKALLKSKQASDDEAEEEWKFDLGDMDVQGKKAEDDAAVMRESLALSMSSVEETLSKLSTLDDDLTFISQECNEAAQDMDEMKKKTQKTTAKTTKQIQKKKAQRTERDRQAEAHMEKRRAQRAARMEKAKKRIEEEKQRKAEEEKRKAALDMSEPARRDRAYQWYLRCGMISRDALKQRIAKMTKEGTACEVTPEDIDLMPWNFNGSVVNASKMMSYSMKK